jgi:hypothetical protein
MRKVLNPVSSPAHYGFSIAIQLSLMANLWLAARGVGSARAGIDVYIVAPLILGTLTMIPISVADWGSREAVALLFFSAVGLSPEEIVAISVIYGAVNLVSALPAALLLLAAPGRRTTAVNMHSREHLEYTLQAEDRHR